MATLRTLCARAHNVREIRTYGSARGVPGNRHSYRNYRPHDIGTLVGTCDRGVSTCLRRRVYESPVDWFSSVPHPLEFCDALTV